MASVPEPRRAGRLWLGIVLVLTILLVVSAFLPGERILKGICVIEPTRSWSLTELRPGTFESRAMDLAADRLIHYRLFEFDRPSLMDLQLPALDAGQSVPIKKGQVVVRFSASSLDLQIAERRSQLESAKARLAVLEAGAKPSEISWAKVAVEQARADLKAQHTVYRRTEQLFADGIAAEQDWEEVQADYRLKELNLELAQAEMHILESGSKPEELDEVRVSIAGFVEELAALEVMLVAQEIKSPIAGRVVLGGVEGPLISAGSVDSMLVKVLLPQRKARFPKTGHEFTARIPGAGLFEGVLLRVDRRPMATAAGTFLFAIGQVENKNGVLEEGMQGRAEIHCGSTSLLDLILGDLLWSLGLTNGDESSALKPIQGWGGHGN
jgi:hypothetical protein